MGGKLVLSGRHKNFFCEFFFIGGGGEGRGAVGLSLVCGYVDSFHSTVIIVFSVGRKNIKKNPNANSIKKPCSYHLFTITNEEADTPIKTSMHYVKHLFLSLVSFFTFLHLIRPLSTLCLRINAFISQKGGAWLILKVQTL